MSGEPRIDEVHDEVPVDRSGTVISGTRWGVLSQVIIQVTRLVTQVILARLLAPNDFGLITLGFTLVLFLDLFKDLGTVASLIQKPVITQRLVSTLFFVNVGFGLLAGGAFILVSPYLASLAAPDDSRATGVFQLLGLTLTVSSFVLVPQALIRRARRFRRLAFITSGNALVVTVVSVGLAFAGASVWALVIGQLAGTIAGVLFSWPGSGARIRPEFSMADLRSVWGFGASVTAFNVFNYFFLNADKLIVGAALGPAALGIYGLGQRVLFYPVRSVTQMLQQVLFPTFARIDDAAIRRGYLRSCAGIALVTFPVMAGCAVVAGPLVRTVFGPDWNEAVFLITVLAPVGMLHSLQFTVGSIYTSKGEGRMLLWWGVLSGTLTVSSYFAGLPWGINGIAVSYAICIAILTYPTFAIPFRFIDLKVRELWRSIRALTYITATMCVIVLVVRFSTASVTDNEAEVLAASVAAGVVAYVALLAMFRPPALKDLARLIGR